MLGWRSLGFGRALALGGALGLLLLSLPTVAALLMAGLEPYPALQAEDPRLREAGAIVVLAANSVRHAPEYAGATLGDLALQRVRYAAWLQRRTGLPLIVSGGLIDRDDVSIPTHARVMAEVLEQEFRVPVSALEERSATTFENAGMTARLLAERGIGDVLLVTHAWHLPRAARAFERAGVRVIPAPTAFAHAVDDGRAARGAHVTDWLPSASALRLSSLAWHEYLGRLWYALRAFFDSSAGGTDR